jgi:hypothetical protein
MTAAAPGRWALLSYRIPREPSSPRIAVWRKLDRLGVARIGDGLVALPADARTREQLDWIAQEITDAGGTATIWLATPASPDHERDLADAMRHARAAEYQTVIAAATQAATEPAAEQARTARRLRDELRRIDRRDFFPPPDRDLAHTTVAALTTTPAGTADATPVRRNQR